MDENYREICKHIFSIGMYSERFGVELMTGLLDLFGHPQHGLHIVHIAGTNGKGSTAFYTASILEEAGHRVGLYTSPHLVEPTERIRINGECISEKEFADTGETVLRGIQEAGADATTSDVLLMMALILFRRHGCDYAVIETGLGGKLDSINALTGNEEAIGTDGKVIGGIAIGGIAISEVELASDGLSMGSVPADSVGKSAPAVVTCITRIGLDHTALLGDTIREVAASKAGILKRGTKAVLAANEPGAMEVLEARCKSYGIPYRKVAEETTIRKRLQEHFPEWTATYQRENMANALVIADSLGISFETACRGLKKTVIPGRLQLMNRSDGTHTPRGLGCSIVGGTPRGAGWLIVDGAHNPQGAKALAESLGALFPWKRFCCIVGMVRDKNVDGILQAMLPRMEEVYLVPTGTADRRLPSKLPEAILQGAGIPVRCCKGLKEALEQTGDRDMVLVFGSLYLTGEVLYEFSDTNRSVGGFGSAPDGEQG